MPITFSPKASHGRRESGLMTRLRSLTNRRSSLAEREPSTGSMESEPAAGDLRASHTTDGDDDAQSLGDLDRLGYDDDSAGTDKSSSPSSAASSPRNDPGKPVDDGSPGYVQRLQDDNSRLRRERAALERERDAATEREEVLGTALFEQTRKAAELESTRNELAGVRQELAESEEQYHSIEGRFVELKLKMAQTLAELDSERVERQAMQQLLEARPQMTSSPVRTIVPPPGAASPMLGGKIAGQKLTPAAPPAMQRGFAESIPFRMGENGQSIGWESSTSISRSYTTPDHVASYDSDRESRAPPPLFGQRFQSERLSRGRRGDDDDSSISSFSPNFQSMRFSEATDDSSSVDLSVTSEGSLKVPGKRRKKKKKGHRVALSRVEALKKQQSTRSVANTDEVYARMLAVDL